MSKDTYFKATYAIPTQRIPSANGIAPLWHARTDQAASQAEARRYYQADQASPPLKDRFRQLARQWQEETEHLSSTTRIAAHPAYQEIIKMGWEAVPLILQELQREPDDWFVALKTITGQDPVSPMDRGNLSKMTEAWLKWARRQGINLPKS